MLLQRQEKKYFLNASSICSIKFNLNVILNCLIFNYVISYLQVS